ncbi:MAG: TylF/MycF/NovP-related O-methyltransferase [Deltaproteobacteria bacterium]|nr:TylF/MycF/NovP-related O-methyltransferase [Deltaproteobacteria bacterium]
MLVPRLRAAAVKGLRVRRGRGTLYRRLQSLRFLAGRDRRAVLAFLRGARHGGPRLSTRLWLVARFVRITNQVRAYHSQAQMLAVAEAILARAGQAGLTVVECGAGKGASTAKLSLVTALAGGRLVVFDSFRGMPPNDERHQDLDGRPMRFRPGAFRGRLREVQRTVAAFGAPEVVVYRKGWFAETLPELDAQVDVALLDVDLLASTRTCLTYLTPRLRAGGVIFTQDGHLRAVAALLADARFWRDEAGVEPPPVPGVGREKFLAIRFDAAVRASAAAGAGRHRGTA